MPFPSCRRALSCCLALCLILVAGLLALPARAQTPPETPQNREQIRLSFAPVVAEVAPAVVNIYTARIVEQRAAPGIFADPMFRRFFGDAFPMPGQTRQRVENALGSGVILRADGIVVTNHHVINNADQIRVVLTDRREFEADVLLSDERTDIAVLRLKGVSGGLPAARLGDPDSLLVGDLVLAIGNPFGVGQTVTSGIVSALARTEVGVGDFRSFIQTDAAINPGNSGGALVALDGSVVGINTAIFARGGGGSLGIGFAVPATMVASILDSAIEGRPLVRPWLGFAGRAVDQGLAEGLGLRFPRGVLVDQVADGGPAEDAGLRAGDVILSVAGREVNDAQELRFRFAVARIDTTLPVEVLRRGQVVTLAFPLRAPPEDPPRNATVLEGANPLAGAQVVNLSPAVLEELGLPFGRSGVMILAIARGSPAARYGFQGGDIVREVNGQAIERVRDLTAILGRQAASWRMGIERDGRLLRLELR